MQEGTLLNNRYQLLQKIGSGGMAEVFRARDSMLERYVSIKVLRADYTENQSFRELPLPPGCYPWRLVQISTPHFDKSLQPPAPPSTVRR